MKRSKGLQRKTPMHARKTFTRTKPATRRVRRPRMDPAFRQSIWDRDCGVCTRCGLGLSPEFWECHHRLLRSQGGKDTPANCITLCSRCHSWVHRNPAAAKRQGFIAPPTVYPEVWPVLRYGRTWQQPGDGWITTVPHPLQKEALA